MGAQLVTYPNGAQVPVDTPEGAAAKLAHAAAGGLVNPLVYAGYPYAAAYPYAVGVPGALVAHPNELSSPLTPLRSTLPRSPMPPPEVLSTQSATTDFPTPTPVLLLTPTVPWCPWSPLMSRLPELSTLPLLPALKRTN